jgi:hypothetical protein
MRLLYGSMKCDSDYSQKLCPQIDLDLEYILNMTSKNDLRERPHKTTSQNDLIKRPQITKRPQRTTSQNDLTKRPRQNSF